MRKDEQAPSACMPFAWETPYFTRKALGRLPPLAQPKERRTDEGQNSGHHLAPA